MACRTPGSRYLPLSRSLREFHSRVPGVPGVPRPGSTAILPVLLFVLLFVGTGPAPGADGATVSHLDEGSGPDVRGELEDRVTNEPLEGALVTLEPATEAEGPARSVVSDSRGTFQVSDVAEGEYRLEVELLGYGDVEETVSIEGEDAVHLEVGMVPEPLEMEPVVAVASRAVHPSVVGFHERLERGLGQYLDREDIEAMRAVRATELFRSLSSVHVRPSGHPLQQDQIIMAGGCHPTVYVDGLRAPDGAVALDDYVWPEAIEGVEVYRNAAAAPARFTRQATCGVVAIWTRPPGTRGDEGSRSHVSQRRGFLVSSLLGLVYALMR